MLEIRLKVQEASSPVEYISDFNSLCCHIEACIDDGYVFAVDRCSAGVYEVLLEEDEEDEGKLKIVVGNHYINATTFSPDFEYKEVGLSSILNTFKIYCVSREDLLKFLTSFNVD